MTLQGDGAKVKAVLLQQGRSAAWLGRQMGYERTTFEHLLAGRRPPKKDPAFWERIAGFLGVSGSAIGADAERVA